MYVLSWNFVSTATFPLGDTPRTHAVSTTRSPFFTAHGTAAEVSILYTGSSALSVVTEMPSGIPPSALRYETPVFCLWQRSATNESGSRFPAASAAEPISAAIAPNTVFIFIAPFI